MAGVVGRAIEEAVERRHAQSIVDRDGPDLHKEEHDEVDPVMEREDEHKHVIGSGLQPAVDRVEGNGSPRRRAQEQVVRLVQVPVIDEIESERGAMSIPMIDHREIDTNQSQRHKACDLETTIPRHGELRETTKPSHNTSKATMAKAL